MADIFISYRNTPERRALVSRLALIFREMGVTVWWDDELKSGDDWPTTIEREISSARVVVPIWCWESIHSDEVAKEVRSGRGKLLPMKLQHVQPPAEFGSIHAHDLIGWDGGVAHPKLSTFMEKLGRSLGTAPDASRLAALERRFDLIKPLPTHDPDAQRMLGSVQAHFQIKTQDFSAAQRIGMHTSLRDVFEDYETSNEFVDEAWKFCFDAGLQSANFDTDDDGLHDALFLLYETSKDSPTVGDLVYLLLPTRDDERIRSENAIASALSDWLSEAGSNKS